MNPNKFRAILFVLVIFNFPGCAKIIKSPGHNVLMEKMVTVESTASVIEMHFGPVDVLSGMKVSVPIESKSRELFSSVTLKEIDTEKGEARNLNGISGELQAMSERGQRKAFRRSDNYSRYIFYLPGNEDFDNHLSKTTSEYARGRYWIINESGAFLENSPENYIMISTYCSNGECNWKSPEITIRTNGEKTRRNAAEHAELERVLQGSLSEKEVKDRAKEFIVKHELFGDFTKKKGSVKKHKSNVTVSNLPRGFVSEKNVLDSKTVVYVRSLKDAFRFSRKNDLMKLDKKYHHLFISDFVKESFISPTITDGETKKQIKIRYYDYSPVYAEIERLKNVKYGYIRLTANMKDVDIYINGRKAGEVKEGLPFVAKLPEGRYRIQAKKDFFGSKTISIQLPANDSFAYAFDLKPSGNLKEEMGKGNIVQSTGELVVVTSRNDLKVEIDGQVRIPPFKLPNISSGTHKMRVVGPVGEQIESIIINENGRTIVNLDELF